MNIQDGTFELLLLHWMKWVTAFWVLTVLASTSMCPLVLRSLQPLLELITSAIRAAADDSNRNFIQQILCGMVLVVGFTRQRGDGSAIEDSAFAQSQ